MKPFIYQYLDSLPKIPSHFLEDLDSFKNNAVHVKYDNDKHKRTTKINTVYNNYQVHPEFQTWLEENIVRGAINYGMAFNGGETYPVRHLPHLDQSRDYNLTYIIDTGGPDVQTNFYQEEGYPAERPRGVAVSPSYDNFKLIDSVIYQPERWAVMTTRIIHSVDNLMRPRIAVQIGLDQPSFLRLPIEHRD